MGSRSRRAAERGSTPLFLRELVGGVALSYRDLRRREDTHEGCVLLRLLANAEYWLSFDVDRFESLLDKCPSPLRELGVGVALRFSEQVNGSLTVENIREARKHLLGDLSEELKHAVEEGLETLERMVKSRDRLAELEGDGFSTYETTTNLSFYALRAGGTACIHVGGCADGADVQVQIGATIQLSATDERGRPLPAPEIENEMDAPILHRDEGEARSVVFIVPGWYVLRVPGRVNGDRRLMAR